MSNILTAPTLTIQANGRVDWHHWSQGGDPTVKLLQLKEWVLAALARCEPLTVGRRTERIEEAVRRLAADENPRKVCEACSTAYYYDDGGVQHIGPVKNACDIMAGIVTGNLQNAVYHLYQWDDERTYAGTGYGCSTPSLLAGWIFRRHVSEQAIKAHA